MTEALDVLREVRAHARSLGIKPGPMFHVAKQVQAFGVDPAAAIEEGQRRSDFRLVHEAVERTYAPARDDLTEWGREILCSEGASEVWLPADTVHAVVDREGWDVEAIRDACPGASYEMVLRRLPVIAMEREATLFATIVDDRRIYFRRSSSNPWLPLRRMLPQEALAWQRATIAPERRVYALREPVKRGWVPLRGKRAMMPDPGEGEPLSSDEIWSAPTLSVRVWPVPENPNRQGPRREVLVAVVQE